MEKDNINKDFPAKSQADVNEKNFEKSFSLAKRIKEEDKMENQKKLSRKQKIELEQKQKRKEFTQEYKKFHEDFPGFKSSLGTLKEYIDRKLEEYNDKKLKIPTGKYQDLESIRSSYQHSYIKTIQDIKPGVFDELRIFTPHFRAMFGDNESDFISNFLTDDDDRDQDHTFNFNRAFDKFAGFFHELNGNLFDQSYSLYTYFHREREQFDYSFKWGGKTEQLFGWLAIDVQIEEQTNAENDELLVQFVEFQSYKFKLARKKINDAFQTNSSPNRDISGEFIKLQDGIYHWLKRHNFQKDWLYYFAYYFVAKFSFNNDISTKEMNVPPRGDLSRLLLASDFVFKFNGWWAGGVDKEDYETKITEEFKGKLLLYFDSAYRQLNLGNRTKVTRPRNKKSVQWLVRRTVQKWDTVKIVKEDLKIMMDDPRFKAKQRYVLNQLNLLKQFDLPY